MSARPYDNAPSPTKGQVAPSAGIPVAGSFDTLRPAGRVLAATVSVSTSLVASPCCSVRHLAIEAAGDLSLRSPDRPRPGVCNQGRSRRQAAICGRVMFYDMSLIETVTTPLAPRLNTYVNE